MDTGYIQRQAQTILKQFILPHADLADLTIQPLAGDASTRCYYRIHARELQNKMVLMELGPGGDEQGKLFCDQQELFIYAGLPVPEIYRYDREHGFIFLEDCGDIMLQDLIGQQGIDACYEYYFQAIDYLLQLQSATISLDKNYPAFKWAFDVPKFTYELDFFLVNMVEKFRGQKIGPIHRNQIRDCFYKLSEILALEPRCLTHRDYHSRNMMIKEGGIKILDFQDARLGPCQYDLASLLRDSYVVLSDKMIEELIDYYLNKRRLWQLDQLDKDHFQRIFILMCIQRNLKALGTFGYQAVERNNQTYIPYIAPTLEYLRQNFTQCPEFKDLGELLGNYLPELL